LSTQEDHLTELSDAARRAGSIVTEYIDSIVDTAERQAEEIRQDANRDAELARQEALDSAQRVFERINALERPLSELVHTLQTEMKRVGRELEGHVDAEAIGIAAESADGRDQANAIPSPSPAEENGRAGGLSPSARKPESEVEPRFEQELQLDKKPTIEDPAPVTSEEESAASKGAISRSEAAKPPKGEAGRAAPEPPAESLRSSEAKRKGEQPAVAKAEEEPAKAEEEPAKAEEETAKPEEPAVAKPEDEPAVAKPEEEAAVAEGKELAIRTLEPAPRAETPTSKILSFFKGRATSASNPAPRAEKSESGILSLFKGSSSESVFITTEGHCAVCQRTYMAGTEETLRQSGWRVNGDVGLCPECQSDGWQLPEGARLPFRRGGT